MHAREGTQWAVKILDEEYGDEVQLIHELIGRVTHVPPVRMNEITGLQRLLIDLDTQSSCGLLGCLRRYSKLLHGAPPSLKAAQGKEPSVNLQNMNARAWNEHEWQPPTKKLKAITDGRTGGPPAHDEIRPSTSTQAHQRIAGPSYPALMTQVWRMRGPGREKNQGLEASDKDCETTPTVQCDCQGAGYWRKDI
ncbi:hypothetical protein Pcinc_017361 [Petrolisthes cinctipes]|uniref:Uncharacterized protein n=1 Tax=Petrolisthes cinctipes TaxID=88211 RepID=A0AAE1KMV4_PETCI|nr:hypothetical protein Pcinc_017361 [Petrolisthes cinctipes]